MIEEEQNQTIKDLWTGRARISDALDEGFAWADFIYHHYPTDILKPDPRNTIAGYIRCKECRRGRARVREQDDGNFKTICNSEEQHQVENLSRKEVSKYKIDPKKLAEIFAGAIEIKPKATRFDDKEPYIWKFSERISRFRIYFRIYCYFGVESNFKDALKKIKEKNSSGKFLLIVPDSEWIDEVSCDTDEISDNNIVGMDDLLSIVTDSENPDIKRIKNKPDARQVIEKAIEKVKHEKEHPKKQKTLKELIGSFGDFCSRILPIAGLLSFITEVIIAVMNLHIGDWLINHHWFLT